VVSGGFHHGAEWGEPHDLLSRFQPNCITALGQFDLFKDTADYEHVPLLSEMVTLARARGLSPGGLFAATLTALSAVIPNNVRLQVAPELHSDWFEPPCIWTFLIGPPSSKKSLYHKLATAPLERFDDALLKSSAAAREAFAQAKPKASRGTPPPSRCLIVDYVTAPALRDLLRDNPDRLMLSSEEAATFTDLRLEHRAIYNKAYNGEPQKADRRSVSSTRVRGACMSMLVSSHPDVVRQAVAQPIHDGYWQRFIPIEIGVHHPQPGYSPFFGTAAYEIYVEDAMAVDAILCRTCSISGHAWASWETILRFSDEAQVAFDACGAEIEELAKAEVIESALGAHIKKLDKLIARIALILHFIAADWGVPRVRDGLIREIGTDTLTISRRIVLEYFLPQMYLFYSEYFGFSSNSDTKSGALEIVSRRLKRFSASELKRVKNSESAIRGLQAANWIRPTKIHAKSYDVNPAVFEMADKIYSSLIAKQAEGRASIQRITQFGTYS
jgi:hypothetical protein